MGAFYHSICLRRDCGAEIKPLLIQWMGAKGFRLAAKRQLTQIDRNAQRGVFIFTSKDWTILLYSEFAELERLGYELAKLKRPLLYLWLHDSDVWGYQIEQDRKLTAAFNSNPSYFGRREETGLPSNGDPELLCQTFDLHGQEGAIRKLQKAKAVFMEEICERFASAIWARPAASCYEDAEGSYLETGNVRFDGFETEHLIFNSEQAEREMDGFDLHSKAVREFTRSEGGVPENNLPREMRASLAQMQRQVRLMAIFFRVIAWPLKIILWPIVGVMKLWLWFTFKRSAKQREMAELFVTEGKPAFDTEGRRLINERYRCRVTLPEEVNPVPAWGLTVFAFKVHDTEVRCRAVRPKEVERYLTVRSPVAETRTTVLEDENFMVGTIKAKSVVLKTECEKAKTNAPTTRFMGACIVQSPEHLFCFEYSTTEAISEPDRKKIREVVSSFEMF